MTRNLILILVAWTNILDVGQAVVIQDIRLVGGTSVNQGRVEVQVGGTWGTVCDDQWDSKDADVVCRMLGYTSGGKAFGNAQFGEGSGPILLDDVSCKGNEARLDTCVVNTDLINCRHSEDAGVSCDTTNPIPTAGSPATPSPSSGPVPDRCPSGQKNQFVQLVNSRGIEGVGYVEVRNPAVPGSQWGSMCDDMINENVAKVICGSLCFNTSWARPGAIIQDLGNPRFPIILDDVKCNGQERQVQDCPHAPWGQSNCNDLTEVASVTCVDLDSAPTKPPIPILQCQKGYLIALFSRVRDPALEEKHLTIGKAMTGGCTGLQKATDNDYVTIRIPFEECGTVVKNNKTHIIYSNIIKYDYTRVEGSISRVNTYMIEVSCEMPRNYSTERPMEPLTETVTKKAEGVFVITMQFYLNNSFTQPVSQYPVRITLGEWLNVALILDSVDSRLKLVVPRCYATPTIDRKSPVNIPLFLDKCRVEQSLGFFPLSQEKFGFRYQSFVFVNYPQVYIHCGAFICLATETGAECDRSCVNNKTVSGRRRREALSGLHETQWVNSGPVYVYQNYNPAAVTPGSGKEVVLNLTTKATTPSSTTSSEPSTSSTTNDATTTNRATTTTNRATTTTNRATSTTNRATTTTNRATSTTNRHSTTQKPRVMTSPTSTTAKLSSSAVSSQSTKATQATTAKQTESTKITNIPTTTTEHLSVVTTEREEKEVIGQPREPPANEPFRNPLAGLSIRSGGVRHCGTMFLIVCVPLIRSLILLLL